MKTATVSMLIVVCAMLAIPSSAFADGVLLYDVDFGTPPHVVGQPPVTGTGSPPRETPTSINFGDPTVVAQLGSLADQPCQFGNGTTGYDQLQFAVDPSYPGGFAESYETYHVEMDVLLEQLSDDALKVYLDLPTSHFVSFMASGQIRVFPPGELIGTVTIGVPISLEIDLDIPSDQWTIWLDGAAVYTSPISADMLRAVRLHLGGTYVDNQAAVDNFRVYGYEPPPGCDDLLYDVDFGTPPHNVGQPPVTGTGPAPRETPTDIVFGDPTVVAGLGALTDQPCSFGNGTTGYDQLKFAVDPSYPGGFPDAYDIYYMEMDVLVEAMGGMSFRIFLDLPNAHSIKFIGNGNIQIYPGNEVIGTYSFGVPVYLEVLLDIPADQWTISLDGAEAHTGPANAEMLRAIRWNLDGGDDNDMVGVDNFRVYGCTAASSVGDWRNNPLTTMGRTLSPYPNPTSSGAWIRWEASTRAPVQVDVLTVSGRRVWSRNLAAGSPGLREILWNGRDARGSGLPSGTYFIRVRAAGQLLGSERIILQR